MAKPRTQVAEGSNLGEFLDILKLFQQLQPLIEFFMTLFKHLQPPPPAVIPPAPGPIDPGRPGGPTLPQVPIDTRPEKTLTSAALICAGVEKPRSVGGGPGINYLNHQQMIQEGQAFNVGCVSFWYGQGRDEREDEFLGKDLVEHDLEFRTEYNIYKGGRLVAVMKGAGDDNPIAEGKPADWHQSESDGVGFGSSRWIESVGFDNRIVFRGEGDFEVEFVVGGIRSNRVPFRVS